MIELLQLNKGEQAWTYLIVVEIGEIGHILDMRRGSPSRNYCSRKQQ
jgi:hypothetical protein